MNTMNAKSLLQTLLNSVEILFSSEGAKKHIIPPNATLPPQEYFKIDIVKFLLYLSASDGRISDEEILFINEVFDFHMNYDDIVSFIDKYNIYSEDFENEIPYSVKLCVSCDKLFGHSLDLNVDIRNIKSLSGVYLLTIGLIGRAFLDCDGNDDGEEENIRIYTKNIANYIAKNL